MASSRQPEFLERSDPAGDVGDTTHLSEFSHAAPPSEAEIRADPLMMVERALIAGVMMVIIVITLANVITRHVINYSLAFTEEYSVNLLFILVLLGTASCVRGGQHIRMTFFVEGKSARTTRFFDLLAVAAIIVCFAVAAYHGTFMVMDTYQFSETSPGMGHPQWLYYVWFPILSVWVIVRAAGEFLRLWRS